MSMTVYLTNEHAQSVLNYPSSLRGRTVIPLKHFQRLLGHMGSIVAPLVLLYMRPQHCDHFIHQPAGRYMITSHVTARPSSPPLESDVAQFAASRPHFGGAQSCSRRVLMTAHAPQRMVTLSQDNPADLESFQGSPGRPVCFPRVLPLPAVLLPDRGSTWHGHTSTQLALGLYSSSSSVRNLGVLFDSNLSFESHVSSICKTAFFHLKNISKLRPMLSTSNAEILINAFMSSRLDYCNALLGGCSARLINKLQLVQNAAARVLTRTRRYDHISPVLSTLHWLPIKHRIDFKIVLMTYKALNGLAPQYLSDLLSHYSPPRPLRSQNSGRLIIPRISKSTAGGRSFSFLAPKLWNNLPNTVREADTLCQFKSRLKTHLFNLTYT